MLPSMEQSFRILEVGWMLITKSFYMQPELFYINSYIPFMGVWKQKLTETGRVAKNEAVWIPIKECVVVTTPHAKNVLLLFPNLDENVLPRLTFWEAGARSGYTKRFIDAFVNTGKMDWNRVPIPDSKGDAKRNRFKRNLREWLKFLDHSWYNPVQKGHDFRNYWNVRQDYYLKQKMKLKMKPEKSLWRLCFIMLRL